MTEEEDDFHRKLDAEPDNFAARAAFADWLEERGDWRAAGYRWMWENQKRPSAGRGMYSQETCDWWSREDFGWNEEIKALVGPSIIGDLIDSLDRCSFRSSLGAYVESHTRQAAEEALCRVIYEQELAAVA